MRRPHPSSDRGVSASSYAALLLVSAAVIAAFLVVVPNPLGDGVRVALCKLFGGTDCESTPRASDEDFKPKICERSARQQTYGGVIKIAFVKIGDEYSFLRQEMADGTVRMTVVPTNVELGLETGIGGKLSLGKNIKLGADATIGGSVKFGVGDTYIFADADEANEFEGDVKELSYRDAAKDLVAGGNPITGWVVDQVDDLTGRPDLKDPEITTTTVSASVAAEGTLGLYLPQIGPKGDGSDNWDFNLNTGVKINGEVAGEFAVSDINIDPDNPKTAYSISMSGTIGGGGQVLGAGGEGELKWSGAQKMIFDENGKLTMVIYQTSFEKGGQFSGRLGGNVGDNKGGGGGSAGDKTVETITTRIPIDNDADRAAMMQYMATHPQQLPTNLLRYMGGDDGVLTRDPGPNANILDRLMYNRASVLKREHENSTDGWEVGAEVKLGLVLGAEISSESSENSTTRAQYLGAPQADGRREYVPYTECVDE